jgi:hypothetical protein
MNYFDCYILLKAEILKSGKGSNPTFHIFNQETNRGFAVDGLASVLVQKFDGKRRLAELVTEMEKDEELTPGEWKEEIVQFIDELQAHNLVELSEKPLGE